MPCCCRTGFDSRRHVAQRLDERRALRRSVRSIEGTAIPVGGSQVNLQGIVFDTNDGGRLPVEQYLAATFDVAAALGSVAATSRGPAAASGPQCEKAIDAAAKKNSLNAKYSRHSLDARSTTASRRCCSTRFAANWRASNRRRLDAAALRKSINGRSRCGDSPASDTSEKSAVRRPGRSRSIRSPPLRNCGEAPRRHLPVGTRSRSTSSPATPATGTRTISSSGNGRGWWHPGGLTCCCGTSAISLAR